MVRPCSEGRDPRLFTRRLEKLKLERRLLKKLFFPGCCWCLSLLTGAGGWPGPRLVVVPLVGDEVIWVCSGLLLLLWLLLLLTTSTDFLLLLLWVTTSGAITVRARR